MHRVLLREQDHAYKRNRRQQVTRDDFKRLAEICADALDPEIMAGAWR